MKFTVAFITLLSISTTWAAKDKKSEEPKDKREAPLGYPSSGHSYSLQSPSSGHSYSLQSPSSGQSYSLQSPSSGHSYSLQSPSSGQSYSLQSPSSGQSYSLQSPSSGHSYSLQSPSSGQSYSLQSPSSGQSYSLQSPSSGQSYSLQSPSLGHEDASAISIGAGYSVGGAKPSYSFGGQGSGAGLHLSSEGLPSSGHATIQLAPITLQPSHGGLAGNDLSQLMSQLSHSLNSGAISLQSPSSFGGSYASAGQASHGGQALSLPQYSFGGPKLQQYAVSEAPPSYSSGTKGLSSYSTGPVLFNPETHGNQQQFLNYASPSSGHSFGESSGASLGGSGHSLGGLSLGGSGHSFGGSLKSLGSSYVVPSRASFKPSAYVGSSGHDDSGHGSSSSSGSYSSPSLAGLSLSSSHGGLSSLSSGGHGGLASLSSGGHGASFGSLGGFGGGSSKFIAPSYIPSKSEGFGSSLESVASFASNGHLSSPSGSVYGSPSSAFSSNSAYAASSNNPQYYAFPKQSAAFAEGASSFKAPLKGNGASSSFSSGPKYSFGGFSGSNSRYGAPKDSHGAYSESTYDTIKYSEDLKPHVH